MSVIKKALDGLALRIEKTFKALCSEIGQTPGRISDARHVKQHREEARAHLRVVRDHVEYTDQLVGDLRKLIEGAEPEIVRWAEHAAESDAEITRLRGEIAWLREQIAELEAVCHAGPELIREDERKKTVRQIAEAEIARNKTIVYGGNGRENAIKRREASLWELLGEEPGKDGEG